MLASGKEWWKVIAIIIGSAILDLTLHALTSVEATSPDLLSQPSYFAQSGLLYHRISIRRLSTGTQS